MAGQTLGRSASHLLLLGEQVVDAEVADFGDHRALDAGVRPAAVSV
jgi:hypothetical protein